MKVTDFTRSALRYRRSTNKMLKSGYVAIEADWRLQRGGMTADKYKIEDVKISDDGKKIWYKLNQEGVEYYKIQKAYEEKEQQEYRKMIEGNSLWQPI